MSAASAPGKILLAGEYAILDGAEAVLLAVDRRAVARVTADAPAPSDFLAAAARAVADHLGPEHPSARAARSIAVDSRALSESAAKLGLGSSAAATVAAVAAALAAGDRDDPELCHALAHRAHGDAQAARGARGSGADVAAAVWGGVLAVRPRAGGRCQARPLPWPADLSWVAVWTGQPADTATLVAAVADFGARQPAALARHHQAIGEASAALIQALDAGDARACVAAAAGGAEAASSLGRAAGVAIATPFHDRLAALARERGGAAKPTGAGGGDLAVALFAAPAAAAEFAATCRAAGMHVPSLRVEETGVRFRA